MKFVVLIFIFCLSSFKTIEPDPYIYELENRMMRGDLDALFEIALYFDNDMEVIEPLSYHGYSSIVSNIAKRMVNENCLFTEDEISISDNTTAKQFSDFLYTNKNKIYFNDMTGSFIITPLEKRNINFEFRELSYLRKKLLQDSLHKILKPDWIREKKIDSLIQDKNPKVLLEIASELYKSRTRGHNYTAIEYEYRYLLDYLTGIEIGTEIKKEHRIPQIENQFAIASDLNLLIYFLNNYINFVWDEKENKFKNPNIIYKPTDKEEVLIQLLNERNDSIALDAFIQLIDCDSLKVSKFVSIYAYSLYSTNSSIPGSAYNFIKQLNLLKSYCLKNNIELSDSSSMLQDISKLKSNLTFKERYKFENELINSLTLDEITKFEYWSLIYSQNWDLSFSAGRILDIFYSKNWITILNDKKHLDCFLKKSKLFDDLGVIGICNNYLLKFANSSDSIKEILKNNKTEDTDIRMQTETIISNNFVKPNKYKTPIIWEGNMDYEVVELEKELGNLINHVQDSTNNQKAITTILSQINYQQIPTALNLIENYPFKISWLKYSFLERDFGFEFSGDFTIKEVRDEFLELYFRFTEYELYDYYLLNAGINYKKSNNSLDYDKIYDILKYDIVKAFACISSTREMHVYSLIKLLELTFKTSLGYPVKLCNSNNHWGCSSKDRAIAWMEYLTENKLVNKKHHEPESFTFELKAEF